MRYLISLLFAALSFNAVGQTNPNYNPDYDADGFISVNDVLGVLSSFGETWDSGDVIMGCTYPNATDYNPLATIDDGSCTFLPDCDGDECGVCGGSGIAEGACDCDGNVLDECGVCGGDNSSCLDECGVPNGDNSTCSDECGVTNGDNSTCLDCCGVPNGGGDSCDTNSNWGLGQAVYVGLGSNVLSAASFNGNSGSFEISNYQTFTANVFVIDDNGDQTIYPQTENTMPFTYGAISSSVIENFDCDGNCQDAGYYQINISWEEQFYWASSGPEENCLFGCWISSGWDCVWNKVWRPIYACSDPTALNYSPHALCDDGSCVY